MPNNGEIRECLARIETLLERLMHDLRNYKTAQDALVPRTEMVVIVERLEHRIEGLEKDRATLTKWLIGAWLAGSGVVLQAIWTKVLG